MLENQAPRAGHGAQAVCEQQDAGVVWALPENRSGTVGTPRRGCDPQPGHRTNILHRCLDIGERPGCAAEGKEKGPKLGTRGLHSEGGGGRGLTAWDAVC